MSSPGVIQAVVPAEGRGPVPGPLRSTDRFLERRSCYPARAGGLWLWKILVPSGLRAVVVPSGCRATVQPC